MTTEGVVRGEVAGNINIFRGIPYAAPVDGLNRWLPPAPPASRETVFDARTFGPACEQTVAVIPKWLLTNAGEVTMYEMTDIEGFAAETKSPDCLRLNIWSLALPSEPIKPSAVALEQTQPKASNAPDATPSMRRPVLVHLHGGGLTLGSAAHPSQDGERLAQEGVIVVTINYRLGSIGFLAGDGLFEGDVMTGNRGFMDVVRALEWVRDNIANFGGDPGNVTLMGQSGGGTSVWTVLASPMSEGLVHRAIIMSGPIYDYPIAEHTKLTTAVLDKWGVEVGDKNALSNVSSEDASSTIATTTLFGSDAFGSMSRTYLPSAGAYGTEFLPVNILTAVQNGRLDKIDLLIGNCDDDAKVSILVVPLPNSVAINLWNGYIRGLVADTDDEFDAMTAKYIAALPEMTETRAKEQLQTDALYRIRALNAAATHSARTQDPALGRTYAYQFRWKSPTFPDDIGAMHGMDLIFAFGNLKRNPQVLDIKDGKIDVTTQRLSNQMVTAWANFAKSGNPSSATLAWPEYDPDARKTMIFNKNTEVVEDPQGHLRKLWK